MSALGLVIIGSQWPAAGGPGVRLAALVTLGIAVYGVTYRLSAAAARPTLVRRATLYALVSCVGSAVMLAANGSLLETAGCCGAIGGMAAWAAMQRRLNRGNS